VAPDGPGGYTTNPNRTVGATHMPIFTCPSDQNPPPQVTGTGGNAPGGAGAYERYNTRRSNYFFNIGNNIDQSNPFPLQGITLRGPFGINGAESLTTIRDGTSNTLAIGESKQRHGSADYGPYWGNGLHTAVTGRIAATADLTNPNVNCWKPNHEYYNDTACQAPNLANKGLQYAWGFGSWHTGTTNFVFCDGSVRGVSDNVSAATWIALGTAAAGEAISDTP
jgi:prepilin-type processing-associated H-X9-DG protein